ncbi:MAG: DUF5104 domain-containing protein [Oscillospiraceae bacterium]|nr:DUF5104 domain-containing protein [Oscillospiraceae bacterium]
MKKLLVLIPLIIILLTSCGIVERISEEFQNSRTKLLDSITISDSKVFREMIEAVFAAFDNHDVNGLKSLFAVNALKENPDIESQIEAFFNVYAGPMEIEKISYSTSGTEYIDFGKQRNILHNSYDIIISADGVRYYINLTMYSPDDFERDNEGIHTLNVATEDALNSKYFVYYNSEIEGGGDKPGFYYQDSTEKRDDIMWIQGSFWRYMHYDRSLTADDIRAVVEKNNDFKNLVAVIGEPNCSWTVYKFYYYELDNGLFAVCQLDNTTWERVRRDIKNPDAIVAVYIADETENIETVWISEDYVKLGSAYRHYTPVDRELSEDFFRSFAMRSTSLSELIDEIGPPSVDQTWYAYFQLSDNNRFAGCHYSGDEIEEIFIFDSEGSRHTIWEKSTDVDAD